MKTIFYQGELVYLLGKKDKLLGISLKHIDLCKVLKR